MVGWLLKRLSGAIVAGVGWKLGTDAYEAVKERLKNKSGQKDATAAGEAAQGAEAVAAADPILRS